MSRVLMCHQTDTKPIALISKKKQRTYKNKTYFQFGRSSKIIALNVQVNRCRIKNINIKHAQNTTISGACPWWRVEGAISFVWHIFVSHKIKSFLTLPRKVIKLL